MGRMVLDGSWKGEGQGEDMAAGGKGNGRLYGIQRREGLMRGREKGKKRGMDEKGKHMEDGEVGMRTVREISRVL